MKLRLALGIGALALLIAGLASWDGFDRPTLSGHILVVGPGALPPLTSAEDDVSTFSLCGPRGAPLFVHVLPFTRLLDARTPVHHRHERSCATARSAHPNLDYWGAEHCGAATDRGGEDQDYRQSSRRRERWDVWDFIVGAFDR
jgi:hypothetical protein